MMTLDPVWATPPADLALASDDVHVWRAELDLTPATIQSLQRTLAADELTRAERFHFPKHRQHFITARGVLRAILSRYLQVEPGVVRLSCNSHGKPTLAAEARDSHGGLSLQFNLSHADGLALYAIARGRRVGVDLERIRPDLACSKIAARFFSPRERAWLQALPIHLQNMAFFTCWTRKEAYVKATGRGLALPLDQFDVTVLPEEPATLLHTTFDPDEAARWSLQELHPGPGYVASLAVEGHGWQLACWQWPEKDLR